MTPSFFTYTLGDVESPLDVLPPYTVVPVCASRAMRMGFLFHPHKPPSLEHRWDSVLKEAEECGYHDLDDKVLALAKILFPEVLSRYRGMFDIYPTEDGEIVLDAYVRGDKHYSSVLLICRPDGQVLCSVDVGNNTEGELFSGDDVCVNPFIKQAFSDLQKELSQQHVQHNYTTSGTSDHQAWHVDRTQVVLA